MIKLKNVTKYYPMKNGERHYVLKDVSLEIPSNKNLGILGPNGAGKSTLLRMIGGAESPNSGQIITSANVSWPLGVGVGFQGSLTGRQNIQFVCDINGLTKRETIEVMESVVEFAEIGKFFDMPVKTYSSGMRARLGFGLSITFEFDYYLIDELTSVGDAIFRKKADVAFKQIREKASLVFVAHNLKTLEASCDSALFLRNGEATYYDDIKEGITVYQEHIAKHSKLKTVKGDTVKKSVVKKVAVKSIVESKKKVVEKSTSQKAFEQPFTNKTISAAEVEQAKLAAKEKKY